MKNQTDYTTLFCGFLNDHFGGFEFDIKGIKELLDLLLNFDKSFLSEMATRLAQKGWIDEALIVEAQKEDPDINQVVETWFASSDHDCITDEATMSYLDKMSEPGRSDLVYKHLLEDKKGLCWADVEPSIHLLREEIREEFREEFTSTA